jgi:hypothetical protein
MGHVIPPTFEMWWDKTHSCRINTDVYRDYRTHKHGYKRIITIDCRSPAEYKGGHIRGALNVYCFGAEPEGSLVDAVYDQYWDDDTLFVIHCEFSAIRGPITWARMLKVHAERGRPRASCHTVVLHEGYQRFQPESPDWCDGGYRTEEDCHRTGDTPRHSMWGVKSD